VSLTFSDNANKSKVGYTFSMGELTQSGKATVYGEGLHFSKLALELTRRYKDHEKIPTFTHEVQNVDIELKNINYTTYLTAYVEAYNQTRKEPSSPKLLVLTNTKFVTDNEVALSKELIEQLLKEQGDNFINLYPNPFETDLLIQYELENNSSVTVELYSLDHSVSETITVDQPQTKGKKLIYYDGSNLKQGIYVVRVSVDGLKHTKLIAKK